MGHNYLCFGPNSMKLVSLERLTILVSNGKSFIGFESPIENIQAEHYKWLELKLKRLSERNAFSKHTSTHP